MRSRIGLVTILSLAACVVNAQTVDRTKAPETPPLPAYRVPPVFETKLPNGMSVVLLEDSGFRLVRVRLAFEAGSKFDPADSRGLSEAVASLLNEGTKKRPSQQIAEEGAAIGGSVGAQATPDSIMIS